MKKLLALIVCISFACGYAQTPDASAMREMEGRVVVKVKPELRSLCGNRSLDQLPAIKTMFDKLGVVAAMKKFPGSQIPEGRYGAAGLPTVDISLIYEIRYNGAFSVAEASQLLMSSGNFIYACPHRIPQPLYVPNDPDTNTFNQYYLKKINAYKAWDICKGDTNVVVGIGDTGFDLYHPRPDKQY